MGREKFTYEFVKSIIENDGNILLSKEYIQSHGYLDIQCNQGHNYKMQFYNFKNGHRCPKCAIKYKADKHRTKIEDIKLMVENAGYTLISTEYIDNKITVKCPDETHPKYETTLPKFKTGYRCRLCWHIKLGNRDRLTYEYVKNYIESIDGYNLLSENYKRNNVKLDIQCPEGHHFKMRFNNFKGGQRCPDCSSTKMYSYAEKEILEFVKSIYNGPIIENDRTIIMNNLTGRNLELDIWLPKLNMAIEYNGMYWHGLEDRIKNDGIKLDECKKKGILLYIIMEDEWKNNKEQVKTILKGLVGLHPSLSVS